MPIRVPNCICIKDLYAELRQHSKNICAWAVVRPAVGDRNHSIPGPQHLQKAGSQRIPVSVVGHLHDRAGGKAVLPPAGGVHVPGQFDVCPLTGQPQSDAGVVDEAVQLVQVLPGGGPVQGGGPDLRLPLLKARLLQIDPHIQLRRQLTAVLRLLDQPDLSALRAQAVQRLQIDVQRLHQASGAGGPAGRDRQLFSPGLLRREVVGPELLHPDARQQSGQSAGVIQVQMGQHQKVQCLHALPAEIVRRRNPQAVGPGLPHMDVSAVHQHGKRRLRVPDQNGVPVPYIDEINLQHPRHRL